MKKIILLIFASFLILSCSTEKNYKIVQSNGVKTFLNNGQPSKDQLNLEIKELFKLNGYDEKDRDNTNRFFGDIAEIDFDNEENIYICDRKTSTIKKFNKTGRFLFSFGKKGKGPGEFELPQSMYIFEDTVYVIDTYDKQTRRFTTTGEFAGILPAKNPDLFFYLKKSGNDKLAAYTSKWSKKDDKIYFLSDLVILDKNQNILTTIIKQKNTYDEIAKLNIDPYSPFCTSSISDKIFFSKKNYDRYYIEVLNNSGRPLYNIEKSHRKIPYSKSEISRMYKDKEKPKNKQYKYPVRSIFTDNKDRLWSLISVENKHDYEGFKYYDIFDKGIFVKKIKLKINLETRIIKCFKDRLYAINYETNELIVFQYSEK